MSKLDKRKQRFLKKPRDYTEQEFISLIKGFGFKKIKEADGRVKYEDSKGNDIKYHIPHDTGFFKICYITEWIKDLKSWGYL